MDSTQPDVDAQQWQYGNSFSINHSFTIVYPCPDLLEAGESLRLIRPADINHRYKPQPLVPHSSVQQNYPWLDDTDFTILRQVDSALFEEQPTWLPRLQTHDLHQDLTAICDHLGSTEIKIVTWAPPEIEDPQIEDFQVRISRTTTFRLRGGETITLRAAIYDSMATQWQALLVDQLNEVEHAIRSLLFQTGDRQVRHTMKTLLESGDRYENHINDVYWKDPRIATDQEAFAKLSSVYDVMDREDLHQYNEQTLSNDEKLTACPICGEDLDRGENTRVVVLPCSTKHASCDDCFIGWADEAGYDKATCPICRFHIVGAEVSLPNYLATEASHEHPFVFDDRFTDSENTQRSFADLDSRLAQDEQDTPITVRELNLLNYCDQVVEPRLGPEAHALLPEIQPFFRGVTNVIRDFNGRSMTLKRLFDVLLRSIMREMRDEFWRAGLYAYQDEHLLVAMTSDETLVPLRPGYRAYIEKQLNRILRFEFVRDCYRQECSWGLDETNILGIHQHGDRVFYMPSTRT